MQESYNWGKSIRKLSKAEIRKMKENMQKTPLIQEKSDRYHRKEILEAETILERIETPSLTIEEEKWKIKKIWFFEKIKAYLFW